MKSGKFTTAAEIASGIGLALDIVLRDYGEDLAHKTSQRMVLYLRRSGGQSQFSGRISSSHKPPDKFDKMIDTVARDPTANLSHTQLAELLSIGERHLAQVFKERAGI